MLSRRAHSVTGAVPAPRPAPPDTGGAHCHLVDYLRHEVLTPLPDDLGGLVLRRTAVLDAFRAELADAVTGRADTRALAGPGRTRAAGRRPTRRPRRVVPLPPPVHRGAARRPRARGARPGAAAARAGRPLAGRARPAGRRPSGTRWRATTGRSRPRWVARHAPALTRIGQVETALGWFRALGDDACRADPRLAVARALTGAHTGGRTRSPRGPLVAERVLDAAPKPAPEAIGIRIEIAVMRWAAAGSPATPGPACATPRRPGGCCPAGSGSPSAFILLAVGASQYRTGALDESWTTLLQAESAAEHRGEHLVLVAAPGLRALHAAVGGRPEEAARLAADAEAAAGRHGLVEHFNTATLRAAQGWVALQEDRPRRAPELFRRALELVRRGGLHVEVTELLTASGGGRGAPRMARAGSPAPRRRLPGPRPLPGPGPPLGRPPRRRGDARRRPGQRPGDAQPTSDRDPAVARLRPDHRRDRRVPWGQSADGVRRTCGPSIASSAYVPVPPPATRSRTGLANHSS